MIKPKVWLSAAMTDPSLNKYAKSDVNENNPAQALDTIARNLRGEKLPIELFPKRAYGIYPDRKLKKLPDICCLRGFWTFSSRCKRVFTKFDLGESTFRPITVLQHDRCTLVEGQYFTINFAEIKSSFRPELSRVRNCYPDNVDSRLWTLHYDAKINDVVVDNSALNQPDLWIEEQFKSAFFMSDRLVQALRDAKLTRRFKLYRCQIQTSSP